MTKDEALKLALEYVELVPDDRYNAEHIDREALVTAIKEALMSDTDGAQPEQGYTTKRNEWTNQVTHKCNACGRDDFRSENAAKFHKCEGIEEPKQHSQNKWLNIYTTPPQRTWVGLTDEEAQQTFAKHNCTISTHLAGILARAIEAKLKEKNTHD